MSLLHIGVIRLWLILFENEMMIFGVDVLGRHSECTSIDYFKNKRVQNLAEFVFSYVVPYQCARVLCRFTLFQCISENSTKDEYIFLQTIHYATERWVKAICRVPLFSLFHSSRALYLPVDVLRLLTRLKRTVKW